VPVSDVDLVVLGSGFGGSILALIARRLGLRVALLERGRHPRFAIGESSSPLAGILLEQLADRYDLPRLKPLAAFGAWRRAYPDLVCGLKRGFTYFKHEDRRRFSSAPGRTNQLLVAASPHDEVSDTHWFRADVDAFLVAEAAAAGVEYLDETDVDAVEWTSAGTPRLMATRQGRSLCVGAGGIVDATGPRGALSRAFAFGEGRFDGYPGTQALFSHFTGVARCEEMPDYAGAGARGEAPPYPVDDAALHHVFDGGWMWVLRFGNGVTSAGVAVGDALAQELRLADGEPAWHRLLDRFPTVRAQFAGAVPTREFTWMPRLAYRAAAAAGPRWALLPSAAAFVDPLFSTGFPLTLLGIERLAARLESGAFFNASGSLDDYAATTLAEADHTARFIRGCYAGFVPFERFVDYSMFYFAAASYAEMARRVAPARATGGFLRASDPVFASALRESSPAHVAATAARIAAAVASVNIAGLCDPAKRNWYAADAEDAIAGAAKLGVTAAEVARVQQTLGF
jgi:FADH2 O2-dependent halogenase